MKRTKKPMMMKMKLGRADLSPADLAHATQTLHYLRTAAVLKDFPTKRDKAVMSAMWKWLSLNGLTAWSSKKDPHVFDTVARGAGRRRRKIGTSDGVVFHEKIWQEGRAAFAGLPVKASAST
jgi:hypothetical protein